MSMLRRPGNKKKLLKDLHRYFPQKRIRTFVDLFMGTGAVAFTMVNRCHKVIANDSDGEVINLFHVLRYQEQALRDALRMTPYHDALFQAWKDNREDDPVWRAVRFLVLSNWSFMGQADTMRHEATSRDKFQLLKHLDSTIAMLQHRNIDFLCCDFREALKKISWRKGDYGRQRNAKTDGFLYLDPPYYGSKNIYHDRTCTFTPQDTEDVFQVAVDSGLDFMISEFDGDFVRDLADRYRLVVTCLGERRTMNNRNTEIIITNYEPVRDQLALFAA